MEKYTSIQTINYDDCLNLGNLIVNQAKVINAAISVRIYIDDFLVFQHFMDGTSYGNIPWLEGKRKTVLKTGYSSAYVMNLLEYPQYKSLKDDKELKSYGGGYPLYMNNNLVAIICVSGMEDSLDDHKLIIDAVHKYFKTGGYEDGI